jgi:TrpR family trp operon transcriptional repressor
MPGLNELIKVFTGISDEKKMRKLFDEIFTPAERETFEQRWNLLRELQKGTSQREIASMYRLSLCKITRGSKILKNRNSVLSEILDNYKNPPQPPGGGLKSRKIMT